MVPSSFGLGSDVLAAMATLAPSFAARLAIANPMPRLAPVMKRVLPFNDAIAFLSLAGDLDENRLVARSRQRKSRGGFARRNCGRIYRNRGTVQFDELRRRELDVFAEIRRPLLEKCRECLDRFGRSEPLAEARRLHINTGKNVRGVAAHQAARHRQGFGRLSGKTGSGIERRRF